MAQRYSHLASSAPTASLQPDDSDELLTHEDVKEALRDDGGGYGDGDDEDAASYDDDDDDAAAEPPQRDTAALHLHPSHSSSGLLDVSRESSMSSTRHSESRPFDQDVQQPLDPEQPTQRGSDNARAASSSIVTPLPQPPAAAPSTSYSAHLSLPSSSVSGLRKSASIGDKLAGRARELAVTQAQRLDALVRGIETVETDYVEDHVLETLDYDAHEDTMNELRIEQAGALHSNYLLLLKSAAPATAPTCSCHPPLTAARCAVSCAGCGSARDARSGGGLQLRYADVVVRPVVVWAVQVLMMVLIGFVTAMLMYGVSEGVQLIFNAKIAATTSLIQGGYAAGAYFAFVFMNLAITAVASSLVAVIAPHARGGGVPYALSYLNGTNVADYFSPRIVLTKVASLIFTISGGLTLGMEGPFVFIGGGVALLCSNLIDRVFPFFFVGGNRAAFSRVIRNIREVQTKRPTAPAAVPATAAPAAFA